jgi:hypothetical protein
MSPIPAAVAAASATRLAAARATTAAGSRAATQTAASGNVSRGMTEKMAGDVAKMKAKKKINKAIHALTHWFEYIEWSTDGIVLIPLFFAVVKDILDWIGFSLPVLNEALNFSIMGFSALVFVFIGASSGKSQHVKAGIRSSMKWFVLLAGTTIEEIFGINFLPIESLSIVIAFVLVIWERMEAEPSVEQKKERDKEELSYA